MNHDESLKIVHIGDIVDGTVIAVNHSEVIVDFGAKLPGTCPSHWFLTDNHSSLYDHVKVGDTLKFRVIKLADQDGIAALESMVHFEANRERRSPQKQSSAYEIIEQVRQNLMEMKPALIAEIVQAVTEATQEQLNQLHAENQKLRQRIAQLETIVDQKGGNHYE